MTLDDYILFPSFLPWLLVVPAGWFLARILNRRRSKNLEKLVGRRVGRLVTDLSLRQRNLGGTLTWIGVLFSIVALLQPLGREGMGRIEQRGVDLLICLDVSQSMLAKDVHPSRLLRARREIRELVQRIHGDRLGLVVFAGEARLFVPLTQDMDSFVELVDLADPLSIERGGTDLGAALRTALDAFSGKTGEHEVVILITDGEDLSGEGLLAAKACRERNVTVHCMGIGGVGGSKIVVSDGEQEMFLRDESGNDVISAMDPASLSRIAEETGGDFIDASERPLPLLELYKSRVVPMAQKAFETEERRDRTNFFQWPLLVAVLFWMFELCLTDRRNS